MILDFYGPVSLDSESHVTSLKALLDGSFIAVLLPSLIATTYLLPSHPDLVVKLLPSILTLIQTIDEINLSVNSLNITNGHNIPWIYELEISLGALASKFGREKIYLFFVHLFISISYNFFLSFFLLVKILTQGSSTSNLGENPIEIKYASSLSFPLFQNGLLPHQAILMKLYNFENHSHASSTNGGQPSLSDFFNDGGPASSSSLPSTDGDTFDLLDECLNWQTSGVYSLNTSSTYPMTTKIPEGKI